MDTTYYELAMGFRKPQNNISSEEFFDLDDNAYQVSKIFESIETLNTLILINENNTSQKIKMLNKISKMYNQNTITNKTAVFALESFYDNQFSLEDEKRKSFKEMVKAIWDHIRTFFTNLFQGIVRMLQSIGRFFKSLFAKDVSEQEIQKVEQTTDDKKLENNFKQAVSKFSGTIAGIITSVKSNYNDAKDKFAERRAEQAERKADYKSSKAFYDKANYIKIPDISRLDPNRPMQWYGRIQKEVENIYNDLSDILNDKVDLREYVTRYDKEYQEHTDFVNKDQSTDFRMAKTFESYLRIIGIEKIDISRLNRKKFAKIYSTSNFKVLERMSDAMIQRVNNLQKTIDKALIEVSKRIQADDDAQKKADSELSAKREKENADRVAKGEKPIEYSNRKHKTTAPQILQKYFIATGKEIQFYNKCTIALLKLVKPLIGIKLETWKRENYGNDETYATINALK